MGSKVLGTAFDLLDERTGNRQLTGLNIHVSRADFTPVTFCRALNAVTFIVAERRMSIASWPA
jgi:hypothetical protein